MTSLKEILELAKAYDSELPPAPAALTLPVGRQIAGWIDHTLLKPEATPAQIKQLCEEARQHGFATVCVNPVYVPLAAGLLNGSKVRVCSVVAFPLGATLPEYKSAETRMALKAGATEIDMVINIGALKGEAYGLVLEDVRSVVQETRISQAHLKVIIEAALLTRREKILACLLCQVAEANFVKTSTGFGPGGATLEDVSLMRRVVGAGMGVKAAGGIRTYADAIGMIQAGANRIGASAGISILKEAGNE